jgi:hypothetical protein
VSDGDKAAARQLTVDGHDALMKHDFALAADLYARADRLFHAPTVTLGLARAQAGLGKLLNATELYNRLVHEPLPPNASEAFLKALEDGRAELGTLAPRIPSLIIRVRGAEVPHVTLDGADVPAAVLGIKRPVDPGKHVVHVVAPRMLPADAAVTVAEGKVETVTIDLVPSPPGTPDVPEVAQPAAPPDNGAAVLATQQAGAGAAGPGADDARGASRRKIGFAILGVGGAGVVVGAITAGLAASKRSTLIQQCPSGHCLASQQSQLGGDVDTLHALAAASSGGFIAGGALLAGGLIVVLTAPKGKPPTAAMIPLLGPDRIGLQGSF